MFGIGEAVSAIGQYFTNRQTQKYNTEMANTSWQRGVKDMMRAGLNPALAYQQGGAPSPQIHLENPLGGVPQAVASAKAYSVAKQQVEVAQKNAEAQASQAKTSENLSRLAYDKFAAELRTPSDKDLGSYSPGSPTGVETALKLAQAKVAEAQAGYLGSAKNARETYEQVLQQSLKRGGFSAEQQAALERLMKALPEGVMGDIGRVIMMLIQSLGSSAFKAALP